MTTSLRFDSTSGFTLTLTAENRAEQAILHLLHEARERLTVIERDMDFHESYGLTKSLQISERQP